MLRWLLIGLGVAILMWTLLVALLAISGRRAHASALVRIVPDCLVLLGRLVRDPRLGRTDRLAIIAVLAYLALPFDLIPDFIPVAGQIDDAIIVGVLVRRLRRSITPEVIREHWPGPPETLAILLRGGP